MSTARPFQFHVTTPDSASDSMSIPVLASGCASRALTPEARAVVVPAGDPAGRIQGGAGSPALSWAEASTVADLSRVLDPHLNLVLHRRVLSPALHEAARREAARGTGERRLVTSATDVSVADLLPLAPRDRLTRTLLEDFSYLVELFATLTGARDVGLRLHTLNGAMCPRFHTDRVTLRLICTYVGAGTEWLDNRHVRRDRLGHRADGMSDLEGGAVSAPDRILQMPAGAIGLFKGETADNSIGGVVHRSPQVQGESARLLFTIDPLR